MKKYLSRFFLLAIISFSVATSADAQVIIKVRPGAPVIGARPVRPSVRHVWVGGNYVYRGGAYVYAPGYWAVPRYAGSVWVEGHWKRRRGGWVWMPGHWRR